MGAKERGLSSRQHFAGVVVAGQSSRSRSETATPVSDQGEPASGELLHRKKPTSRKVFWSQSEFDPCDDSKITEEVDGRMSGIELSSNRNARVTEWGGTPLKKAKQLNLLHYGSFFHVRLYLGTHSPL